MRMSPWPRANRLGKHRGRVVVGGQGLNAQAGEPDDARIKCVAGDGSGSECLALTGPDLLARGSVPTHHNRNCTQQAQGKHGASATR
mmetsp:Transcript_38055/g.57356  ORF Transcript_38055/g.57356 Transcript_38055/m.57356 type:complete len:87 (-) Transcript_38055:380-640(-)